MRILVVSSYLPYPLLSGGHIRLYNIIKELSKRHTITLICEKRSFQTEKDIEELKRMCKEVITVNRKKQWSISNIVKTGLSQMPFLLVGHTLPKMKDIIRTKLSEERFDLVHVETSYVMQNVPETYLPVVLVEHNIEYLVYQRFAALAPLLLRPFFYLDTVKLAYFEKRFWKRATKLVLVSEQERTITGRDDAVVVPNGVDTQKYQVSSVRQAQDKYQVSKKEKRILFIGDFKWLQNRDSGRWILQSIWPRVIEKWKERGEKSRLKLWIVGQHIPKEIKNMIVGHDMVLSDSGKLRTETIFQKSDVLLAPIRVGGGTSYKILEAMSCGVPVVTTKLGIEGIAATDGKEVSLADTEENLASAVVTLLKDSKQYKQLQKNARMLVEERYNWPMIVEKLENVYREAIASKT